MKNRIIKENKPFYFSINVHLFSNKHKQKFDNEDFTNFTNFLIFIMIYKAKTL